MPDEIVILRIAWFVLPSELNLGWVYADYRRKKVK